MTSFAPVLEVLQKDIPCTEKTQILTVLLNALQSQKPSAEDAAALSDYAFGEIEHLFAQIASAGTYKEKNDLFQYEDSLLGLIMKLYPNAHALPDGKAERLEELVQLVAKERYLETALDQLFETDTVEVRDVEIFVHIASTVTDEYQRGMVYAGLLHHQSKLPSWPQEARQVLSEYIASELERYLAHRADLTEEMANALEVACDVCRQVMTDRMAALLGEVLTLGILPIQFYAMSSLMEVGKPVPQAVIDALARDLEHADMTYQVLASHRMEHLFPAELATAEYLAKSDLVHWLMYPTELGKQPDEIEYLGCVKVKREPYHVFRFRSDSDTLGDDIKNKWLIGWSSRDGGTFSQFDEYAPYEQKTPEKTLKYIKKKLIG